MILPRDENDLTPKQRLFCDEYCKTGNAYKSYIKTHPEMKNAHRPTIERRVERLLRKDHVQAYIKKQRLSLTEYTRIDTAFVVQSLLKVIKDNEGKAASIRAIELIAKLHGMLWDKPAYKIEENIPMTNNNFAIKRILCMAKEGKISEDSAITWLQMLDQKSRLEEREDINKQIIEKLDNLNSAMKTNIGE